MIDSHGEVIEKRDGWCRFYVDDVGLFHPWSMPERDRVELQGCWLDGHTWMVILGKKPLDLADSRHVWVKVQYRDIISVLGWCSYSAVLVSEIFIEADADLT